MSADIREQIWSTVVEINANAHRLGDIVYDMGDGEDVITATEDSSVAEFEKVAKAVHHEAVRATLLLLATVQLTGKLEALAAQLKESERG
jgi:hypothetical protein